jgi:XTP/dITP diphosphohydrolase
MAPRIHESVHEIFGYSNWERTMTEKKTSVFLAATGNAHKIVEMRQILAPHGIQLIAPSEIGGIPEIDETGTTFTENAGLKALGVAQATGHTVIADDSGIEITALDGRPGIRSARYAGPNSTPADLMAKVLAEMPEGADRSARFVCVIAIANPDGIIGTAEGEIRGRLADAPTGEGGFGYDPIFIPEGYDKTFAELGSEIKDSLSHRARALAEYFA